MNVQAIDTRSPSARTAAPATAPKSTPSSPPPAPRAAAPVTVAALPTPAATASVTSVPASVRPEDRALYLQILKSLGGNVSAALAALQAEEARA